MSRATWWVIVSTWPPSSVARQLPSAQAKPERLPPSYWNASSQLVGLPRWSPMIRSPIRPNAIPNASPITAPSITWKNE